jgi:hypothetical protein
VTSKIQSGVIFVLLIVIFSLITSWGHGESVPTPTAEEEKVSVRSAAIQQVLAANGFFLLHTRHYQIEVFDLLSRQQSALIDFSPLQGIATQDNPTSRYEMGSVDLDLSTSSLYFIQRLSLVREQAPQLTPLIHLDLLTGTTEVVMEANELYSFVLNPSGTHAIVKRFIGEFGRSQTESCIMNMKQRTCQKIDLTAYDYFWKWADNKNFLVRSPDQSRLYLGNIDTQNISPLSGLVFTDQSITDVEVVPNSSKLLLATVFTGKDAFTLDGGFVTYDMKSGILTPFSYGPKLDFAATLNISPDGNFLVYHQNFQNILVEFNTGHMIAEFSGGVIPQWLSDSRGVIGSYYNENLKEFQIFEVDATTGKRNIFVRSKDVYVFALVS